MYQHIQLYNFLLQLADTTLIISHRNSEWCGHGPILEQDIALTNVALDLLGQSRSFYQYAVEIDNSNFKSEDDLAYFRDAHQFKNHLLVEQPNGDWAITILRQFYFSVYQHFFYNELKNSNDKTLASIAVKSLKEVTYHLRWSSEWVIRLGDGTKESNEKMTNAIDVLKDFIEDLFVMSEEENILLQENISVNLANVKSLWKQKVNEVFEEATLIFRHSSAPKLGGKQGNHSNHLTELLEEMQSVQSAYPNSEW
jgi:ring-1,2-phenylacetyl-CoA epoxidase subunit PaaC